MEIALLARHPRQLDQAELDLRMAADPLDAPVTEDVADVVGDPLRHLHEFVGPAGPCPGDGGLEHVPIAVQLVTPLQVAVSIGLAGTAEDRVEVAILLLDRRDDRGEVGEAPICVSRARSTDLPGSSLHQLVHVRVCEDHTIPVLRQPTFGRGLEIAYPAEPLHPLVTVPDGGLRVDLLTATPEPPRDLHLGEAQGAETTR